MSLATTHDDLSRFINSINSFEKKLKLIDIDLYEELLEDPLREIKDELEDRLEDSKESLRDSSND